MARLLSDPIHGNVELHDEEWAVVNTSAFQRLRRLKQLGMAHLTYPNATHTRFAHSIGVVATMTRILEAINRQKPGRFKKSQLQDMRLAALLHDVGHYPYSHLMERVGSVVLTEERIAELGASLEMPGRSNGIAPKQYPDHEEVGGIITTTQPELIQALGGKDRAQHVVDLFQGSPGAGTVQLQRLIHSSFDMDRIDYLLRDARATGVPYGIVDINYLLNHVKISPKGVVGIERKALSAVEHFVLARFFMHKAVYYHKTTYGFEECCRQLLRRARDRGLYNIPVDSDAVRKIVSSDGVSEFDDTWLDGVIQEAASSKDLVIRSLAKAIFNRRAPRLIREVSVLSRVGESPHAGTLFIRDCAYRLKDLAQRFDLPLGCFLLCEQKPLRFEQRSHSMTDSEARELRMEERTEVIRVFNEDPEPVDVVDMKSSILQELSNRAYQTCRLYVVTPDGRRPTFVDELKAIARQWTS